jgi:hypothetical protein
MSSPKASLAPGKQSPRRVRFLASAYGVGDSACRYTSEQSLRSIAWLEMADHGPYRCRKPQRARYISLSAASPPLRPGPGKQKTAPKHRCNPLIFLMKSGAGEGIRTLDPNLGKVVLYP